MLQTPKQESASGFVAKNLLGVGYQRRLKPEQDSGRSAFENEEAATSFEEEERRRRRRLWQHFRRFANYLEFGFHSSNIFVEGYFGQ